MLTDKLKQQARLSIIERLKQKGMPGLDMSPVPSAISPEDMAPESETLNDMGIAPGQLKTRLRKKKPRPESDEALEPVKVTSGY